MLISARFVFNPSEWHPHVLAGGWCAFRVSKNRPRCPVCAGQMKKNGTTSKGTTRWRCKDPNCGSSTTRTRTDLTQARNFKAFVSYVTSTATLSELAGQQRVSRWTLDRRLNRFGSSTSPTTVPRSASTIRSSSTAPTPRLAAYLWQPAATTSLRGTGPNTKQPTHTRSYFAKSPSHSASSSTADKAHSPRLKPAGQTR